MKKLSLSIIPALLLGALVLLPGTASAQDEKQAQMERDFYDACYTKKDKEKCYELSKQLVQQYPASTYAKNANGNIKNYELTGAWEAFQAALKDYYAGAPDVAKLERLFSTGDNFLKIQPDYPDVVAQQALAGSNAALADVYKNMDKVKGYAEKALAVFAPTETPNKEAMDQARWTQFRELIMAYENQFLGIYYNQGAAADPKKALEYLNKSIAVRSQSGAGWKDPNNYWLRSVINNSEYGKLSKEYGALPDDQKTGEPGKALLKQIGAAVDKVLPDYARVIATATKPEHKGLLEAARETFKSLWDFRTGAPEKAEEYLKGYAADPTVADLPVPAKPEETAPPVGPPVGGANVKLTAGSGTPGAANGKAAATKAGTTKKATPATTKKKKGRR
jgi:hypothetical protein